MRAQERLRHEEEVEANNGVWWAADLIAVPYDEDETRERGIKRGAGKVCCLLVGAELLLTCSSQVNAALMRRHRFSRANLSPL